ncbi:hypothetical protein NP493_547g00021 [Ridgeia piscesae]|uniref:Uncharacterized protein n=1 Tax=Ridgeia piscesae TaxID=27915 RepID=A0AAD9KVC2_RIDPI|nr:hypothetical protein NP493_547g00021 [Ridgeia piscesae]
MRLFCHYGELHFIITPTRNLWKVFSHAVLAIHPHAPATISHTVLYSRWPDATWSERNYLKIGQQLEHSTPANSCSIVKPLSSFRPLLTMLSFSSACRHFRFSPTQAPPGESTSNLPL